MQLAFERVQQHPAIRALSAAENCARRVDAAHLRHVHVYDDEIRT
jgi:hypothetical protein